MKKIKLDPFILKKLSIFSSVSKIVPKDCFESNGTLVFMVNKGDIGRAVGKKAGNIPILAKKLNVEKIRVIEFDDELIQFIKNVIHPNKVNEIVKNDEIIILKTDSYKVRGYLIGKDVSSLRLSEEIIKRYFDIKELKVQQIEVKNE
ncbi:hypothetical protein HOK68_02375 [Candidatus Woesearchaeota archaeon]|jgi:transcription termination/antitermination protein NusA|nr:hypothetical protein [Candidatus Woesearchaeota archaeon]MBT4387847.1 hypothetical protein [Candidatus Woesearchaeota archaeon]MBT4595666.1 hypothetical protein [Candidatus Woesearchaeota archaeon]MBT5740851.1 hypothetical protein [Candidatus Woesearchaeota archaeon]MBT6505600.1 hypothetical protein [Candidatus Woesearchaeota archaeon]